MINSSMIEYPRKCLHCEYIANNPAMYSYHRKTHDPIPQGVYCHFDCGCLATFKNTGGKYTCKEKYQECPAYIKQLSDRTKKSWVNADFRKEQTKKSLKDRLHNDETYKKQSETRRKKFGTLDPIKAKEFRHYARFIRQRAQKWAKMNGYVIGKQSFHIDHKFSILDAWHAGLPESVVNHPANLEIVEAKANVSKGSKSSITLDELLRLTS